MSTSTGGHRVPKTNKDGQVWNYYIVNKNGERMYQYGRSQWFEIMQGKLKIANQNHPEAGMKIVGRFFNEDEP